MPLPRFELQSDTCNAAEAVRGALGFTAGNASALDFGAASGGECGALAAALAALPTETARRKLRGEFIFGTIRFPSDDYNAIKRKIYF